MNSPSLPPISPAQGPAALAGALREAGVEFLRLQFCDILGTAKNVEVPWTQFEKAFAGDVSFDGSSILGFTRVEEADMLLRPDPATLLVLPGFGSAPGPRVARAICDVTLPGGEAFDGDPRAVLRRQIAAATAQGLELQCGPEPEFFLFLPGTEPRGADSGGYFDLAPLDRGERIRREIAALLLNMGFHIEAAHHEVAPGQHEIDFRYQGALQTADAVATFRWVVRRVAGEHGLRASFMPKPLAGVSGSGMHLHLSLLRAGENAFFDPQAEGGLSALARHFIAGLLEHAPALCAVTNPLVNSYKRLVPGFEAPDSVAWSSGNRSALVRIPAKRGVSTRAEFRLPDPSCNPYLALAAILAAGLDGVRRELSPPPPIERNIYAMTVREKRHHRVRPLPRDLREALEALERDELLLGALGEHTAGHLLKAGWAQWEEYSTTVHPWELRWLDT